MRLKPNLCPIYGVNLQVRRTDSWGYLQSNGHFDGLVGLLEQRVIDFGSSPLLFKLDRMPFVDYGYGNWMLKTTTLKRRSRGSIAVLYLFSTISVDS
ncbi:hypothetical protein NQ317_002999 [Molorchus minor]|uniref:Uncharacterized protein n=1 Tax=Molorchus minor TaxID=1323400 RepID=A0ABQ9JMU0_9CUCU|nr:hypothetical protein NQ317_002999 [Molorchus minor]